MIHKIVNRKNSKYILSVLLCWMAVGNVFAGMTCVDWMINNDGTYQRDTKCFYLTGDYTSGDYCVTLDAGIFVTKEGIPCSLDNPQCTETVESFWVSAVSDGCDASAAMAIFPLSDTYLPFLFLLGVYGISIYYKKKKRQRV